ncbi:uncharacterized protein Z520_06129 [Fonsecaea multimorphosa CBS 102226]|uniref:DUF2423 domain-containing protein n=1 Tax=Fonsecaea multimorphosa CBS 102226 TaxID=1442371 RepID=A0A0D2H865_9EURO|nr:uncharacterized protein Z520_06129 [Fonsecaea multimorphosa CBS 102226]KIX98050.1 hypothetical protein Z520_06129 [Fonsecaea multimorphosa CBS 102226]OAL24416.1 hypothetical protein AYO22_05792 [Fonsecaea multimorphosa]
MAKSARASVVKKNHRNLRAKVYGPASDARTARLSAKLQELAAKPKPETEKAMDVDDNAEQAAGDEPRSTNSEGMDIDAQGAGMKPVKSSKARNQANRKTHKVSKRKSKNSVVFASEIARKNKMARQKTRR